jgi:PAS domain S-box-containing protein
VLTPGEISEEPKHDRGCVRLSVMTHPPTPSAGELLTLLDALPASVALWDRDVRLRYGNRRSLTRFGRPVEELAGAHLSDLVQAHAVELSAAYIHGALAGRRQQVERAMVDANGQRYNAHQVTHVPDVVGGEVIGYCALAVDITESIEGFDLARHAREQAALRAERERIAGDIVSQHVVDDLNGALERLDVAVGRASEALPSLGTAADVIDRAIRELRATVPGSRLYSGRARGLAVQFPALAHPDAPASRGVRWPREISGAGWSDEEVVALLDLVPAEIAVWDDGLRNVFANTAALRVFGAQSRSEVQGVHARELFGRTFYDATAPYAEAATQGSPQQFDSSVVQRVGLRHLQVAFVPRVDGAGMYSLVVDVTARVQAELALQDARAGLAAARERERIADDLHSLVIQRLFAAGMAATRPAPDVTDTQLRSVQDGILAALDDLHAAMTTLHQRVGLLDLLPDLARLVHETAGAHGIAAVIENVGSVEYVSPAVGTELLAVAEEVLSNVVEHAAASQVVVTVAADASGVWLRIVDDGVGIGEPQPGKGIVDMLARATRLNGTCSWRPGEPSGTVVDWRVPAPQVS